MSMVQQLSQPVDNALSSKEYKINVDHIFGRSISCNIAVSKDSNLVAFASGSTIVLRDLNSHVKQSEIYLHVPTLIQSPTSTSPQKKRTSSNYSPARHVYTESSSTAGLEDPDNFKKGKFRAKSLASIALSPSGKWLACGEQGQAPRIFIWDLRTEACIAEPRYVIKSHAYGVKHLSFSQNSQYLASVGYIHDGGIHVWDFQNGPTKLATNRVTARLQDLLWVDNMLLTIGTRHVRIWQWDGFSDAPRSIRPKSTEEAPRVLQGRNLVLGEHVHSEFLAACALDNARFFCATRHAICIADVVEKRPLLEILSVTFEISCMTLDSTHLLVGDTTGRIHRYEVIQNSKDIVLASQESGSLGILRTAASRQQFNDGIQALHIVDSGAEIVVTRDGNLHVSDAHDPELHMIATASAVLACKQESNDQIIIASEYGEITKSSLNGKLHSRRLNSTDELSTLAYMVPGHLIYGTKQGEISLVSIKDMATCCSVLGHDGAVTKIISNPNGTLFVSLGRDRMVQLFERRSELNPVSVLCLIQTFDEHSANVTGALFMDGKTLISCSADRTIVVRVQTPAVDSVELSYDAYKIIDLKSAVMAMAKLSEKQILVSCLDKSLLLVDVFSGDLRELCKTEDSYDHIAINQTMAVCCCASSQDRSICLRSLRTGQLVSSKGYCHVDNITSLQWSVEREDCVLSTGLDGLVVMWWFQLIETPLLSTPVRKIRPKISESTYTDLSRSPQFTGLRRSSSLTRSGRSPARPLSPSKLRTDSCERSSLASNSTKLASPVGGKTDVGTIVSGTIEKLERLMRIQTQLSAEQVAHLKSATKWLGDHHE